MTDSQILYSMLIDARYGLQVMKSEQLKGDNLSLDLTKEVCKRHDETVREYVEFVERITKTLNNESTKQGVRRKLQRKRS